MLRSRAKRGVSKHGRRGPFFETRPSGAPQDEGGTRRGGSELVVHAAADDVGLERDVERIAARAGRVAIGPAEIDIEIFELGGPVVDEGVFQPAAEGPADLGLAEAAEARDRALDLAERRAAGEIGQETIER